MKNRTNEEQNHFKSEVYYAKDIKHLEKDMLLNISKNLNINTQNRSSNASSVSLNFRYPHIGNIHDDIIFMNYRDSYKVR